jgi:hypothetical protein
VDLERVHPDEPRERGVAYMQALIATVAELGGAIIADRALAALLLNLRRL